MCSLVGFSSTATHHLPSYFAGSRGLGARVIHDEVGPAAGTDSGGFDLMKQEPWCYTLMMLQPEHITQEMFGEAVAEPDHGRPNRALDKLRLERFTEGLCMQIMHIGPYCDTHPSCLLNCRPRPHGEGSLE